MQEIDYKVIYKVNDFIEINYACRGYCKLPYRGHKNGCPNFGKHNECPPKVKLFKDVFDTSKDLHFIIEEFNLNEHIEKMKQKHPKWSIYQLKNLLYWQNGVRHNLYMKVLKFIADQGNTNGMMYYTLLPEAMGIDVFKTCSKLNIPIEKQPTNKIFKIALVGYRINDNYDINKISKTKSLFDY